MSFPSSHLIYHPILANNNNTNVQQMPLQQPTQQQVHNLHNLFQPQQQQSKPIHVKVLVFETKKEDLSALETLKPTSIRRSERVLSNYADLTKYLTEKCGLTLDNALIRYQDDENHWVDISSDEELAYGIQLCRDSRTSAIRSIFRVAVILLKKEEEKPKQPEEKRECPYWKGRRHGGCPFRRPRHNISENHPFMFRKTLDGENVLEVDIDVEKLKNGLNVNEFVRENIDKVQIPHFGVTCDGCGKYAFVGKRFKCDDCDDFDFCEDCFASENVRNAHCGGSHSFTEQQPRSACFLRNIFGAEKKEEETVIDNQLYEEQQQPVVVEQPIVAEEQQPVVVEEPVVVPEPINVFQIPHPLNPVQQPIIEEPVVVQQPPIVQQPTPYQTELALLRDMGFVDEISNLTLLNKYNGDLQRVIVDLIH